MLGELNTCQFSDSFFPVMDGVTLTVSNYLSELSATLGPTCAVVPAFPGYRDSRPADTYRYFSLPLIFRSPYRLGIPQLDLPLKRMLQRQRFDLVHAHSPFQAGRLALKLARQRGIPVVATFHTKYRDKLDNALRFSALVDWEVSRIVDYYESVDQVWVPSEASRETLREYGYSGPAEVVRHGIDIGSPADEEALHRRAERLLGVSAEDFVFLYVGEHAWEKNLAFLIRSLAAVKRTGERFKMVFVGEGYAARAMKRMTAKLGLGDQTIFTGVLRDRTMLAACYSRADCFLFPSLFDTCGLVVREAAACGVPSVLIAGSAAAEGVVDRFNGFVTKNSIGVYAETLRMLIANPLSVAGVGGSARLTLCRSWKRAVEEVKDRYLCLARKRIS